MQAQERDYVQHLLLLALYSRSQALIFKGGTALRLVYRGNRYSEDLDFSVATGDADLAKIAALQDLWRGVVADLGNSGVAAEARHEFEAPAGYTFDVSYQGPLYDGRDRSKGKVRVDISLRVEASETRRELVHSEYDDVRPFVVTVLTPEHLLAEKVRALLVRGKPRDLYDVWLLQSQGVRLDRAVLARKLALYDLALDAATLDAALARAQADWERDLRPLLPQYVEYEAAVQGTSALRLQPGPSPTAEGQRQEDPAAGENIDAGGGRGAVPIGRDKRDHV
jgi:predicted nucleotidyltransferase component of viral defense system